MSGEEVPEEKPEEIGVVAVNIRLGTGHIQYGEDTDPVLVFCIEVHGAYLDPEEIRPVVMRLALDSLQAAALVKNLQPILHTVPTPEQQAAARDKLTEQGEE